MDHFEAVETNSDNHVGGWVSTRDGVKLWVDVHGMGRPILFIHGWSLSSLFWRRQLDLADQFQIITMDLRGHGRSQSVLRGNTVHRYARDVREVITSLNLRDVLLTGWSMGGSVLFDYWQQFDGDRLSGLVIIESCPAPMIEAPWNTHHFRGMDIETMTNDVQRLKRARKAHGERFINNMFIDGHAPAHAMNWMMEEYLKTNDETATTIYQDYLQRDYTPVLPTISVPTLAVYGRSRHMCFGPSTGRYVAGSIPASRFVILDKSGHLPFYEEAGLFNEALSHFANTLP